MEKRPACRHADHDHKIQHSLLSVRAHAADPANLRPEFAVARHRLAATPRTEHVQVRPPLPSARRSLASLPVSASAPAHHLSLPPLCDSRTTGEKSHPETSHQCPTLTREFGGT